MKLEEMLQKLGDRKRELELDIEAAEDEISSLKDKLKVVEEAMENMENGNHVDEDELWDVGVEGVYNIISLNEEEVFTAETLLRNAKLSGPERADLESMLEDDDLDRRRYQEIVNSHIHIIHQHQK